MIYYEDNEFKIREILKEDIVKLFCWSVDAELNKFDPKPLPKTTKELKDECIFYCDEFDKKVVGENPEEIAYKYFIITNKEDTAIGFINFFDIDKVKKQGELGVKLGDIRYWHKGIATKSLAFVTDYIFNNMGIDRIYIETEEENEPALKLFNRSGFKRCGYLMDEGFKFVTMEKFK